MNYAQNLSRGVLFALVMGSASAVAGQSLDPGSVVERWSDTSTYTKVIDINFSDTAWPDSWAGETGRDCPSFSDGGYVNAVIDVKANPEGDVRYPVLFHNCTFATSSSYGGYAGATAAFSRQYYLGESATGNATYGMNNWTWAGHTAYLEDNITYDDAGRPIYGEAGFVQMCRDGAVENAAGVKESRHGWMEIDHIPYVERVQWSWSSTSWGRGIKCDVKIGDGEWKPLVWMGSDKQKQGWTVFSDQGYFMENVINAFDVSLRWRVWDGEDLQNPVQGDGNGSTVFTRAIDPYTEAQAPRVHKIRIFGDAITADQALYARENPLADVGELSDLSQFGGGKTDEPAPDDDAPIKLFTVAQDGSGDYATIQEAINAVSDGARGIIYIRPGVYEENLYAGTKDNHNRFISLIGEDAATTVVTSSVGRGGSSTATYNDCAALNVYTPRFYAENLTIRNTAGASAGQAEALYTGADAHTFYNCVLSGYQDTYKANVGSRGYFKNCVVEGSVDFIYDGGLEWFEDCELRCRKAGNGGYIAAPAESGMPMTKVLYPSLSEPVFYPGLFFSNCRVTAESGVSARSYSLGRPWKETSGAMFLNCSLGNHISAAGWTAWGGSENSSSLYEYRNTDASGNLITGAGRATFSHQATDAEVEAYMNPEYLFGRCSDVPFDYEKIIARPAVPANFLYYGGRLSWDENPQAAGYIVYLNGEFDRFTTVPSVEDYDQEGVYSVRSVSRYGAMSAAVKAEETVRLTAFPTAEGFGKFATGGRGGRVVTVTSLADDGSEGTLRWAFEQYKGEPITILFAVSGEIALTKELRVSRNDWTLAGQSAPGEGIVITRNKVNLGGSQNFIVRNMRFRIGQKSVAGLVLTENACAAENCANFIFDHCSFGWSVEENMNTADSHFLTVQYSMVHEGLYNAGHSKGARGYGCQWGGSPATYHHNLLAHNNSRSCRFNGARGEDHVVFLEYANNVNYNYGSNGGCYGGENTAPVSSYNSMNSAHDCNFMNNYYRMGPASNATTVVFVNVSYAREGATSWAPSKWFVDGNVGHGRNGVTQNNWRGVTVETYKQADIKVDKRIVPATPYYKYTLAGTIGNYVPEMYMLNNLETAEEAYQTVLDQAGTINRDKVEARVANDARTGTVTYGGSTKGKKSGIIDTENDAEGFFAYSTDYTVAADTDGDGMPDAWEMMMGLDHTVADNNRLNKEGYTALEVYLNSLMGEEMSTEWEASSIHMAPAEESALSYDATTRTVRLKGYNAGATVAVYATDGRLIKVAGTFGGEVSLSGLERGIAILRVEAPDHTPRVLKVRL